MDTNAQPHQLFQARKVCTGRTNPQVLLYRIHTGESRAILRMDIGFLPSNYSMVVSGTLFGMDVGAARHAFGTHITMYVFVKTGDCAPSDAAFAHCAAIRRNTEVFILLHTAVFESLLGLSGVRYNEIQ